MTRPQIIRADTLDLQDQNSPTAQDHTRQPAHPAPLGIGPAAPHQAAALHHVQEERASEEEQLRQAWTSDPRADPPSDDEYENQNGVNGNAAYHDQSGQQNGNYAGHSEDQDMGDAESDDEDMMDKISSSPSIDDGGYISRSASTVELATPQQDRRRSSTVPSPGLIAESSPFVETPVHLPLGTTHRFSTRQETPDIVVSSPFTTTPVHFPLSSQRSGRALSEEHHQSEYTEDTNVDRISKSPQQSENQQRSPLFRVSSHPDDRHGVSQNLERDMSVTSLNEEVMGRLLLPADDPLLDKTEYDHEEQDTGRTYTNLTDVDDEGWETESDPSSFNSDDYNDDASNDVPYDPSSTKDSRFVDSGWGGECLQETEDIDFEFVYALHTFVATVEGQANATKGDTMVLLDDSNSYWWLVRIVKDSSIGYLPAEHIETPTERLARLNKHRNIDLSQTMLGDTADKPKNPLKKAMKRRNARTVQFSAQPIYVEASDYEFSSDEEDEQDDNIFGVSGDAVARAQQNAGDVSVGHSDAIEPLAAGRRDQDGAADDLELNGRTDEVESRGRGGDMQRQSEDSVIDKQFGPGRSRNGTVRNTDSFYRDETVETRKITLTPNILRDESLGAATNVRVSETRERASIDSIGRSESSKEDKKRKEKKPGMFSGLFKKKDKKTKGDELDEKLPGELSPKLSEEGSPMSPSGTFPPNVQTPQRTGSRGKLQKENPRADGSPFAVQPAEQTGPSKQPSPQPDQAASITQQASMRMVQPSEEDLREQQQQQQPPSLRVKTQPPEQLDESQQSEQNQSRSSGSLMSGFIDNLRSPDDGQPRREKVKKAKQRVALDDFDSSPDEERGADPFEDSNEYTESRQRAATGESRDRLSESPVQVSPVGQTQSLDTEDSSQPPGLVGDTSSQEDHGSSLASSPEFEDVGTEFKQPNPVAQNATRSFSPGNPAAPAPLAIKKQPSVTSISSGHYVPPPPTRAAPTPGMERSASPQVRQVSGARSVTPTGALARQASLAAMNQRLPSSSPTSTSDSSATPTAPSTAPPRTPTSINIKPEPQWSDAALRAYMDDTSHVRNLLLLVHDTSGVVPLGPEDPKVQAWYPDERRQLKNLERNLDGLLQGWVDKKRKVKGLKS